VTKVRKTMIDYVRQLTKEKPPKVPEWHDLRGRITLSYALSKSGLDKKSFGAEYLYKGRAQSNLLEKWLSGETVLYPNSAARLDKRLPGTLEVFNSPLFKLLADRPLSDRKVNGLLKPYQATKKDGAPIIHWKFPNWDQRLEDRTLIPVLMQEDTHTLFTGNDWYSFVAILGVVRLADAIGDSDLHGKASRDMFRALPAVLKLPWFRQHAESLIPQLEKVRNRMLFSVFMFDVDWDVIWRQVDDPNHQPNRLRRPRDPVSGRFVDIEDPIMEAQIIPGAEVKRRERAREAKAAKKLSAGSRSRIDAWLARQEKEWPERDSRDQAAWEATLEKIHRLCIEFAGRHQFSPDDSNHLIRGITRIHLLREGCAPKDLEVCLAGVLKEYGL
jgi:hypothetical protein